MGNELVITRNQLMIDASDDESIRHLAQTLLAMEIATSVLGIVLVLQMIEGDLLYRLSWHWRRLVARHSPRQRAERVWAESSWRMWHQLEKIMSASS